MHASAVIQSAVMESLEAMAGIAWQQAHFICMNAACHGN